MVSEGVGARGVAPTSGPALVLRNGRVSRGKSARRSPANGGTALFRLRVNLKDAESLLKFPLFVERFEAERSKHLADLRAAKREYVAAHRRYIVQCFQSMRGLGWSLNKSAKVLGVAPSLLCVWTNRYQGVGINGLLPSALKVGRKRQLPVKPRRALNFLLTS